MFLGLPLTHPIIKGMYFKSLDFDLRDHSQIISATKRRRGVWEMLTIANKGGEGGQPNADNR